MMTSKEDFAGNFENWKGLCEVLDIDNGHNYDCEYKISNNLLNNIYTHQI